MTTTDDFTNADIIYEVRRLPPFHLLHLLHLLHLFTNADIIYEVRRLPPSTCYTYRKPVCDAAPLHWHIPYRTAGISGLCKFTCNLRMPSYYAEVRNSVANTFHLLAKPTTIMAFPPPLFRFHCCALALFRRYRCARSPCPRSRLPSPGSPPHPRRSSLSPASLHVASTQVCEACVYNLACARRTYLYCSCFFSFFCF
jgi:hypothetical protein